VTRTTVEETVSSGAGGLGHTHLHGTGLGGTTTYVQGTNLGTTGFVTGAPTYLGE